MTKMVADAELERVAAEYRDEGYAVTLRPGVDLLPPFATGHPVELLAVRGNERVLVGVKQDRTALAADPGVPHLAAAAAGQPGWRYDLVVLEKDDPLRRLGGSGAEPTADQIEEMLAEAEEVAAKAGDRAALVLAWAALDATLRRVVLAAGLDGRPTRPPVTQLRELYANGHLSAGDFRALERTRKVRAEVVHGLAPRPIESGLVAQVTALSRKLLAGTGAVTAAP